MSRKAIGFLRTIPMMVWCRHHAKSVRGTDLSQYLLQQGQVATILARGPVVITFGAPGSVTVTIAGHARQLPPGTRFTITRNGIKRA